jgi:hypothetical protein
LCPEQTALLSLLFFYHGGRGDFKGKSMWEARPRRDSSGPGREPRRVMADI